jgi:hypothetical protein
VVKLQAYSDDVWTVPPAYESAALTWNAQCLVLFLDQTYKWWRITIEDGSNPDEYIEIGRICAGKYYEPGVNIFQELEKRLVDPSVRQESEGRQGYAVEKDIYRVFGINFEGIDRTQQGELETMFRAVKTIRPIVFALDPDEYPEEDTVYCVITTPLSHALGALRYGNVSIELEELVT